MENLLAAGWPVGSPIERRFTPLTARLALAASLVCTSCAVVFISMSWRLSATELRWAWPGFSGSDLSVGLTPVLAGLFGGLALVASAVVWRQRPAIAARRSWLTLLFYYSAVFGVVWFLPVDAEPGLAGWLAVGGILAASGVLIWRNPRRPDTGGPGRSGLWLWVVLALSLIVPISIGVVTGVPVAGSKVGLSLLTYPVYAFVQLGVFMVIPARRLRELGLLRHEVALVCATLFALVHWPNPVVLPVTFAAMVVWALDYMSGRRWLVSALLMGVMATAFSQFLPETWTGHMKVGPGFIRRCAVSELGGSLGEVADADSQADPLPAEFLARIYPLIIGREATAAELAAWTRTLAQNSRCHLAYYLSTLPEYARVARANRLLPPPPPGIHWTEAPAAWRSRFEEYGSPEYLAASGGTREGVFLRLYQVFYRRSWPEKYVLPEMKPNLKTGQRRRLVEVLHENRRRWSTAPFDTITADELQF